MNPPRRGVQIAVLTPRRRRRVAHQAAGEQQRDGQAGDGELGFEARFLRAEDGTFHLNFADCACSRKSAQVTIGKLSVPFWPPVVSEEFSTPSPHVRTRKRFPRDPVCADFTWGPYLDGSNRRMAEDLNRIWRGMSRTMRQQNEGMDWARVRAGNRDSPRLRMLGPARPPRPPRPRLNCPRARIFTTRG